MEPTPSPPPRSISYVQGSWPKPLIITAPLPQSVPPQPVNENERVSYVYEGWNPPSKDNS